MSGCPDDEIHQMHILTVNEIACDVPALSGGSTELEFTEVLEFTNEDELLQTLRKIPEAASHVQQYQKAQKFGTPLSLTQVVTKVVLIGFVNNESIHRNYHISSPANGHSLKDFLQEPLKGDYTILCKLALEDLTRGGAISIPGDSLHFLSTFCCKHSLETFDHRNFFGLIVSVPEQSTPECNQQNLEGLKLLNETELANDKHGCEPNVASNTTKELPHREEAESRLTSLHYRFVHPLLQEFLAAYALSELPPLDQLRFLANHVRNLFESGHTFWLQFFIGLSFQKEDDFNATKMIMSTLLDVLSHYLDVENKSCYIPTVLKCINEADEKSIWRKVASNHEELLTLDMTLEELKGVKNSIVAMVTYSGIGWWTIEASKTNADTIKAFMPSEKVAIITKNSDCTRVKISPRHAAGCVPRKTFGACGREYRLNMFLTKATKEILLRVLQLYSKVKLKEGDSSASYVSFISCECFKHAVKESMTFEPMLPIHFLEKKKNKNVKYTELEQGSETADALHLETHDGNTLELVILTKPYLRSVTFVLPITSQEYCIKLSEEHNDYSASGSGDIANKVFAYGQSEVECLPETASCVDRTLTEMVYPLIPELSKAKALLTPRTSRTPVLSRRNSQTEQACESETQPGNKTVNIEQACESETQPGNKTVNIEQSIVNKHKPTSQCQGDNGLEAGVKGMTQTGVEPNAPLPVNTVHLHFPVNAHRSNSHFTNPSHREGSNGLTGKVSTQTGDQCRPFVATQSSKQQETYPPGTVLYTSLPREIPSDYIQPLPDESQLIKRGGNGSIFGATMSGMTLAIKKTNYRSKEFAILTKIHHRNIMPLLAFILGEEIPTSRRRYHCYHVMPRLTGDCARMLTDKKEFTMKNLRLKHRENPRLLGLIQSNSKFIVREVLHGLSYLHSLHIAHRDIKGSNILLKFFCSCNNPLDCACTSKYQVVITDFDAAIELDKQDQLFPSSSALNHTHTPRYQCIPVGTNGFRAPECSMHIVTNSPNAFSPPISTKCDLWSLGVLVCRMLVGYEGPYSQRDMAMLVLRYHQIAGYVEGVSRFNIAHIDDYVLEEILQVCNVCVCV